MNILEFGFSFHDSKQSIFKITNQIQQEIITHLILLFAAIMPDFKLLFTLRLKNTNEVTIQTEL